MEVELSARMTGIVSDSHGGVSDGESGSDASAVELMCPICIDFARPPVRTQCCSRTLCEPCSKRLGACPLCRTTPLRTSAHPSAQRAMAQIPMDCKNLNAGCLARPLPSQIKSHALVCPFEPVRCPISPICTASIRRHGLEAHILVCPKRSVVCNVCAQHVPFPALPAHAAACLAEHPTATFSCPSELSAVPVVVKSGRRRKRQSRVSPGEAGGGAEGGVAEVELRVCGSGGATLPARNDGGAVAAPGGFGALSAPAGVGAVGGSRPPPQASGGDGEEGSAAGGTAVALNDVAAAATGAGTASGTSRGALLGLGVGESHEGAEGERKDNGERAIATGGGGAGPVDAVGATPIADDIRAADVGGDGTRGARAVGGGRGSPSPPSPSPTPRQGGVGVTTPSMSMSPTSLHSESRLEVCDFYVTLSSPCGVPPSIGNECAGAGRALNSVVGTGAAAAAAAAVEGGEGMMCGPDSPSHRPSRRRAREMGGGSGRGGGSSAAAAAQAACAAAAHTVEAAVAAHIACCQALVVPCPYHVVGCTTVAQRGFLAHHIYDAAVEHAQLVSAWTQRANKAVRSATGLTAGLQRDLRILDRELGNVQGEVIPAVRSHARLLFAGLGLILEAPAVYAVVAIAVTLAFEDCPPILSHYVQSTLVPAVPGLSGHRITFAPYHPASSLQPFTPAQLIPLMPIPSRSPKPSTGEGANRSDGGSVVKFAGGTGGRGGVGSTDEDVGMVRSVGQSSGINGVDSRIRQRGRVGVRADVRASTPLGGGAAVGGSPQTPSWGGVVGRVSARLNTAAQHFGLWGGGKGKGDEIANPAAAPLGFKTVQGGRVVRAVGTLQPLVSITDGDVLPAQSSQSPQSPQSDQSASVFTTSTLSSLSSSSSRATTTTASLSGNDAPSTAPSSPYASPATSRSAPGSSSGSSFPLPSTSPPLAFPPSIVPTAVQAVLAAFAAASTAPHTSSLAPLATPAVLASLPPSLPPPSMVPSGAVGGTAVVPAVPLAVPVVPSLPAPAPLYLAFASSGEGVVGGTVDSAADASSAARRDPFGLLLGLPLSAVSVVELLFILLLVVVMPLMFNVWARRLVCLLSSTLSVVSFTGIAVALVKDDVRIRDCVGARDLMLFGLGVGLGSGALAAVTAAAEVCHEVGVWFSVVVLFLYADTP